MDKKHIKAVIFDLDDTLMDTSGQLVKQGQTLAAKAMVDAGLELKKEKVESFLEKIREKYGAGCNSTSAILDELGIVGKEKERLANIGYNAYHKVKVMGITSFPGTEKMLKQLKEKKIYILLMSHGTLESRNRKIDEIGLRDYFDSIITDDAVGPQSKGPYYKQILKDLSKKGIKPEEILSVGDRIDSEIQVSKKLGMITVQVTNSGKGRYSGIVPACANETPDYKVSLPKDILKISDFVFGK